MAFLNDCLELVMLMIISIMIVFGAYCHGGVLDSHRELFFEWNEPPFVVEIVLSRGYVSKHLNGFVLDEKKRLIITTEHGVKDFDKFTVIVGEKYYKAARIWGHSGGELCVLRIDPSEEIELMQLVIAKERSRFGEPALVVGFRNNYRYGIPINVLFDRWGYIWAVVQHGKRLKDYYGLSGSVLLNSQNEAIGILYAGSLFLPTLRFMSLTEIPKEYWPERSY